MLSLGPWRSIKAGPIRTGAGVQAARAEAFGEPRQQASFREGPPEEDAHADSEGKVNLTKILEANKRIAEYEQIILDLLMTMTKSTPKREHGLLILLGDY